MKKPRPTPPPTDAPIETVQISAMGGEGEGLAMIGGRRVVVPLALPGETVTLQRSGDRTALVEVLEKSAERRDAPCVYFGECGGCALQHWAPEPYSAWKIERLKETLAREDLFPDLLPAFVAGEGSRRRLTLHVRRGTQKGVAHLGFKARKSWDLVPIEACLIADPALNAALPGLARLAYPFLEHPKSAPALHVTLTTTGLDIEVSGVEKGPLGLSADARFKIAAIGAELNIARLSLSGEVVYGARAARVRFGEAVVDLPTASFLQAVASAEAAMVADAVEALAGRKKVMDLFCGAGTFSFPLAKNSSVTATDSAEGAVAALRGAIAGAPGLKTITPVVRDLFRRPYSEKEMKGFDGALFDPPRAGAAEQAASLGRSAVTTVVGVSCNPATFVRDAKLLTGGGFRLTRLRPVDQFLYSPHIELVGVFER